MKIIQRFLVIFAIILPSFAVAADASSFTPDQTKQIQQIVRDYLLSNPQILLEVSQKLQEREQKTALEMQKKTEGLIPQHANELFFSKKDAVAGNPKGNITLVEFFDVRCPHCKDMKPVIDSLIKKNPDLKIVFKEFPIFGGPSLDAAKAELAAYQLNKTAYFKFHDALLAQPNPLTNEDIMKIARKVGLNASKLKKKMEDPEIMNIIKSNFSLAEKLNINFTPVFFVAKTKDSKLVGQASYLPGAVPAKVLQEKIDQAKQG